MRENRTYGSEGGGGGSRSLPLSEDDERAGGPRSRYANALRMRAQSASACSWPGTSWMVNWL